MTLPRKRRDAMSVKSVLYVNLQTAGYQPLVDTYEAGDCLVFEIEIPGINPEEVLIKVHNDVVIVQGVKREGLRSGNLRYLCMERKFAGFRRLLKIPVPVNVSEGRASYKDGVITLRFPKMRSRVLKIEIEK
jgi:HSP20 family protein